MYERVLVTGGSGFVGRRLQKVQPQWDYISSKEYDLTSKEACQQMFEDKKPDAVVHLASKVGGIKENSLKQAEFYYVNTSINTNVLDAAKQFKVNRVLSLLSTCAFPNVLEAYPFTEDDLFRGPPAPTNFSYGFTKRMLQVQSISYRKQYGLNYSTFCPSNVYGPEDNFDLNSSHFVAALARKLSTASAGQEVEFWGTGAPLRQQLYVDDLAKLIPLLLENHNTDFPLIVSPNENLSIKQMIQIALKKVGKELNVVFNNQLDGQYRKDGSNKELKKIITDIEFTPFDSGFEKTYKWYEENK